MKDIVISHWWSNLDYNTQTYLKNKYSKPLIGFQDSSVNETDIEYIYHKEQLQRE